MGKKARNRAQRRAKAQPRQHPAGQARPLVTAATELIGALEAYGRAVHAHRDDLEVLALPDELHACAEYALSGAARADVEDLAHAWRIVDEDLPVLGALPHSPERAHESHRPWRGPLTPHELIVCADVDEDEDDPAYIATYREHLAANAQHFAAVDHTRQSRQDLRCGRETKGGRPCQAHLVYMPTRDRSFETTYPCRSHLTEDEHHTMAAVYGTAQREHDCPGCEALAGQPCFVGENDGRRLKLVDGEWARKYKYKDLTVHDARLHAAAASLNR